MKRTSVQSNAAVSAYARQLWQRHSTQPATISDVLRLESLETIDQLSADLFCEYMRIAVRDVEDAVRPRDLQTDQQIAAIADMIRMQYPHYLLEDLRLCFRWGKMGCYGEVCWRINLPVVAEWLRCYNHKRELLAYWL